MLAIAVIISACDNNPLQKKAENPLPGKIVFSAERDSSGYHQVYTVNASGADLQQVTFLAEHHAYYPAWAPGGDSIIFVSDSLHGGSGGGDGLFIIAADGSALHAVRQDSVTDAWGFRPVWSPAGDLFAHYRFSCCTFWGPAEIFVRDLEVGWSWGTRRGMDPAWSSDGAMLAFVNYDSETAHEQVYIDEPRLILPSSPGERITETAADKRTPVWTPDDTRIEYISDIEIIIRNLESGEDAALATIDVPVGLVPVDLHAWISVDEDQLLVTYRDSYQEYINPEWFFAVNVQYLYAVNIQTGELTPVLPDSTLAGADWHLPQ